MSSSRKTKAELIEELEALNRRIRDLEEKAETETSERNRGKHVQLRGLKEGLERLGTNDHLCLLYESEEEWRATVVAFLSIGFARGEKCIYILDVHTAEQVRESLQASGIDVPAVERTGQFVIIHKTDAYTKDGLFDPNGMIEILKQQAEKARESNYPGVRLTEEKGVRSSGYLHSERLLEYEAKLNQRFFPRHWCTMLCQYHRRRSDPAMIKNAIMTHPLLVRNYEVHRNFYYVSSDEFITRRREERQVQDWLASIEQKGEEQKRVSFLSSVIDSSSQPLTVSYPDGHIMFCNRAFCMLTGYTEEELHRMTWAVDLTSPEGREYELSKLEELRRTGIAQRYETECIHKDGSYIPIEVFIHQIPGPGGTAQYFYTFITDIRKRKEQREELARERKRFKTLFQSSPVSLWDEDFSGVKESLDSLRESGVVDLEGHLEEHPEVVERLAGKVRVNAVNTVTLQMFDARDERELQEGLSTIFLRESYAAFKQELAAIARGNSTCETEVDARTLSGEKKSFIMRWTVAPGSEETYSRVIVSLVDVTEKRRAEKERDEYQTRLRAILDNTVQALILVDKGGTIVASNSTAKKWSRAMYKKDIRDGSSIFDYVSREDRAIFEQRFRQALEGKTSHGDRQIGGRWVEFNYVPVSDSGEITGVCISLLDVEERIQSRRRLEEKEAWFGTLVRYSSDVIVVLTRDSTVSYLSDSVHRVLGRDSASFVEKNFFDFVHPDDRFPLRSVLSSSIERGGILVTPEFRLLHDDGSWVWVDAVGSNLLEDVHVRGVVLNVRDILERKKTEEELGATRERFRAYLDGSSEVTVVVDQDLTITYQSSSIERVLGYTPSDRVGKNVGDLIHPDDRARVKDGFRRAMENPEELVQDAIRVRHRDGSWRIVEATGRNLLDNPAVRGIVINYHDVTERRKAEEMLRQSEARFRTYLGAAEDIVVVQDRTGRYLYYNGPRAYGLSQEKIVGKVPSQVHKRSIAREIVRNVKAVVKTRKSMSSEMEMIWAGKKFWFAHTLSPITDERGRVTSVLTVARDITHRKSAEIASEEARVRYERLAESISELIYRADAKTLAPTYVNTAVRRFYGYTKNQWLKKPRLWKELIHPEDRKRVGEKIREARKKGRNLAVEYRIVRRDGSVRWVEDHISWERDEYGRPVAIDGVMHDVTLRRRAEEEIARRERIARERARLLSELRDLSETDEILTRVCRSVRDSGLFERAVMTLHRPGGEIVSIGYVGLSRKAIQRALRAPPLDRRLRRRIMSKRFRISNSFFVPAEARLSYRATDRYVPEPAGQSKQGDWKAGDELFVPLDGFSGETIGFLSVDTPTDRNRPSRESVRALEMLVEAAATRVREAEAFRAVEHERDFSRSIVETANSLIVCLDSDARIVIFNDESEKVTGYRRDEVIGKHWPTLLLPPDERHPGLRSFKKWIQTHPSDRYEGRIVTKGGEERTILWSNSVVSGDAQGEMLALAIGQDVTERRRAQDLLEASERRFKELANLLPQTVFETNLEGRITYANEHALESAGYSHEDFEKGVSVFSILAPEQRGIAEQNIGKILKGEKSSGNEYTAVRKDGKRYPVIVYSAPIVSEGKPVGLRGVAVDISEQRRMADEIARGKEYVEAIFNSVTDSIFVTDLKRRLVTCNRATERIFGYAREEMIGRSAKIFYPSESSFRSAGRKYLAKIREQGYQQGEVVLKRKDGSTFLSYASATLLADTEGKPMGLVVVVRDISKREDPRR